MVSSTPIHRGIKSKDGHVIFSSYVSRDAILSNMGFTGSVGRRVSYHVGKGKINISMLATSKFPHFYNQGKYCPVSKGDKSTP